MGSGSFELSVAESLCATRERDSNVDSRMLRRPASTRDDAARAHNASDDRLGLSPTTSPATDELDGNDSANLQLRMLP